MSYTPFRVPDEAFWDERIAGGAELGEVNLTVLKALRELAGKEIVLPELAIHMVEAVKAYTYERIMLNPPRMATIQNVLSDALGGLYLDAGYFAMLLWGRDKLRENTEELRQALADSGCPPVKLPAAN